MLIDYLSINYRASQLELMTGRIAHRPFRSYQLFLVTVQTDMGSSKSAMAWLFILPTQRENYASLSSRVTQSRAQKQPERANEVGSVASTTSGHEQSRFGTFSRD